MVRVNTMPLLGAFLGLLCLAVPSYTETANGMKYMSSVMPNQNHWNIYLTHCWALVPGHYLVFAPIAFFVGVALAFVTPLGGIGMGLGIVSFYNSIFPQIKTYSFLAGTLEYNWGAAFYIGILATIVTLVSFVIPIGPGYSEMYRPWPLGRGHLKERLLVWGRGKKS